MILPIDEHISQGLGIERTSQQEGDNPGTVQADDKYLPLLVLGTFHDISC